MADAEGIRTILEVTPSSPRRCDQRTPHSRMLVLQNGTGLRQRVGAEGSLGQGDVFRVAVVEFIGVVPVVPVHDVACSRSCDHALPNGRHRIAASSLASQRTVWMVVTLLGIFASESSALGSHTEL